LPSSSGTALSSSTTVPCTSPVFNVAMVPESTGSAVLGGSRRTLADARRGLALASDALTSRVRPHPPRAKRIAGPCVASGMLVEP
jgi:hypothetical protein